MADSPNIATTLRDNRAYRIEPGHDPRLAPHIGALAEMLRYARLTTLHAAHGMTREQLDAVPAGFRNSAGMLLAHIAAVHRLYHGLSFEGRDVEGTPEFAPYLGALTFGEQGEQVRGHDLDWYVSELDETLRLTLAGLAARDDAWLASSLTVEGSTAPNHHWAWFHVMEDEVSHRGQLRVLRQNVAL